MPDSTIKLDPLALLLHGSTPVRLTALVLLVASTAVWVIAVLKGLQLARLASAEAEFVREASRSLDPHELSGIAVAHSGAPGARVVTEVASRPPRASAERPRAAADRAIVSERERAAALMSVLGTVASAAPFVGLFGRVYGIMDTYLRIGAEKSVASGRSSPGVRAEPEAPTRDTGTRPFQWQWLALGTVILLATAARVWVILHFPEPDGDAAGHLGIATALLAHPLSISVHWVWPPGYHYVLAALLALGVTARGVRLLNCALAALLPVLVWAYGERTIEPSSRATRQVAPFLAGLICAAMPVVNLLGTSAQQETLFTILVLSTVWAIDSRRFALGGTLLAISAMVRYEAWGAVGVLAGLRAVGISPRLLDRLPAPIARLCRLPLVVTLPSVVAILGWFLAHRLSDGTWLGFLQELYRYTHVQRESFHQDRWTDLLWFPVMQPYYLFGLTLPLFFLGLRRAWRVGYVVPLGIYFFLLVSYTFKGALGSGRYYESLTPFVCVSAAYGVSAIGERWRSALPLTFAAAFAHVVWLLVRTGRWTFHV